MPTRTINLKMVLGKKAETGKLRRALWTTHKQINQAVAEIERILLLCRGASYWTLDKENNEVQIPESQVVTDALQMARDAQRRNGKEGIGGDEEILKALRLLYEQMVPSCLLNDKGEPLKGDAKSIGSGYSGPLFDPDTCAIKDGKDKDWSGPFAEVSSKRMGDLPNWIIPIEKEAHDTGNVDHFTSKNDEGQACFYRVAPDTANEWFESPAVQNKINENKYFNKDKWKKEKDKGNDVWAELYAKKQMELSRDPRIKIREKLWEELGLLPIGDLFFDKETPGNVWNRLALRLAVAHFLSWESWNHRTKKEHERAKSDLEKLRDDCCGLESNCNTLREYEAERHAELKRVASVDDERPFKILVRSIRAWDRVREAWLKNGKTEKEREQIYKRLQTKLRGKFGDPALFLWLAQDGREHLWKDADSLTPLVKLNAAEWILKKRKKYSLMTFADAHLHPRWTWYEAPGGSNLRKYSIDPTEAGLLVGLTLLVQEPNGVLNEKAFTIPLAPSGQFSGLKVEDAGKGKKRCRYRSSHQSFEGIAGGAELLFHRPYLEHKEREDKDLSQRPGPVWFKLTLDVQTQAPEDWLDGTGRVATPPEVHHFNTALSNKSKHANKLQPGMRVLSVDLGLRTFASCSVFELVQGRPEKGLCFPAADDRDNDDPGKLWAKHERSFKLTLPGETPTKQEKEARKAAWNQIGSRRRDIGRLKNILRLSVITEEQKREDQIKAFFDSFDDASTDSELSKDTFQGLDDQKFKTTPELWQQHCRIFYDKAEKKVSAEFSKWRRSTRPKSASWKDWSERRNYAGGKSIWMVDYLENVRKLILSWNLRGRTYGEVNRQDKKQFGTIASRLLHHINRLKEDRTKSGADLIVQAARGFVPGKEGKGWLEKHEPCRVILFEDLARYRFRVDRPRRENSQLMKWSHREIVAETEMQAQIYGMVVQTTMAGFSSRYLASNGAPGVRCRCLGPDDFEDGLPKRYVVNELEWMLGSSKNKEFIEIQAALKDKFEPGMLVPWSGGELFATLKTDGKTAHIIHADLNAAQNLQRRFWGRCGDAYRIRCRKITTKDEKDVYELDGEPGVRLLGALQQLENGRYLFHLVPDAQAQPKSKRYVMEPLGAKKKKLKAEKDDTTAKGDDLGEALAELDVDADDARVTFFRDPSGVLFDRRYWIPSKEHWSIVKRRVWKAMKPKGRGK